VEDLIPSSKKMGKHERLLLDLLASYFEEKGFEAYPHVQLNISWGNIISDVDLVVMSGNTFLGVEVKSKNDNLKTAFKQIDRISDFFDGVYIASDKPNHTLEKYWRDDKIGLLLIENGKITEKECELLLTKPRYSALIMLRKTCLLRLAKVVNVNSNRSKSKLAFDILMGVKGEQLRSILKSIVTCERKCQTECPIWGFDKRLITPLRNIEQLLAKYGRPKQNPTPLIPAESEEDNDQKS